MSEGIFDILSGLNSDTEQSKRDTITLAVAFGSAIFVIVPYIANLIIAIRIKNYIKTNEAAKAWYVS